MDTKTCSKCQMTKPLSAFPWGKDKRLKAGGAYKSQLTLIAVALKVTATDGVCTADGMPSARLVIGPDT